MGKKKKIKATNFSVEFEISDDIPVGKINEYKDLVVYGVARGTLDYTLRDNRFPYKTGQLQRSAMADGVIKQSDMIYYLEVPPEADYTKYVWAMKNVNWTNPDTYEKWFNTVYTEKKDLIIKQAIDNAIRSVK